MNLFDIFGKRNREDITGKDRWTNDRKALEIYSGMRVVVNSLEGQVLFIARLQDPQGGKAELYQYSDTEVSQDTDLAAPVREDEEFVEVKIRGYNDHKQTAVFMEGKITPKGKHIWQIEDLMVTRIENERSFSRLETDMDAAIIMDEGVQREEMACRLLNISVGGAGIASNYRFYKGDRFLLRIRLFEDRSVSTLHCEVLRVIEKDRGQFEYGCQFLELPQAIKEEIAQELTGKA